MTQRELAAKYNITRWDKFRINWWGVAKNATTSIKRAFITAMGHGRNVEPQMGKATLYISREEAQNNGYENIAIIRNPYDRFVSMYIQIFRYTGDEANIRRLKINSMDKLLDYIESQPNEERNVHFKTQSCCLVDPNIRYYDITEMDKLSRDIGIPIPHENKGAKRGLTDQQKDRVYKIYKEDFDKLGYEK